MSKERTKEAIEKAGGTSAVASLFGIKPASVSGWIARGSVPAEHCPAIERHSKGAVRCEDLRPDVDWAYLRQQTEEEHDRRSEQDRRSLEDRRAEENRRQISDRRTADEVPS
jgi:DNA-binding transcriptional regulator YdaS (Cro superfamily)